MTINCKKKNKRKYGKRTDSNVSKTDYSIFLNCLFLTIPSSYFIPIKVDIKMKRFLSHHYDLIFMEFFFIYGKMLILRISMNFYVKVGKLLPVLCMN